MSGINGVDLSNYKEALRKTLSKMFVDENGCWIWMGYIDYVTGYGQVTIGKKKYKVHRFIAYCFNNFDLNSKLDVRHTCDVRNCINPFHLLSGTRSDNIRDAVGRNRWHNQYSNKLATKVIWK